MNFCDDHLEYALRECIEHVDVEVVPISVAFDENIETFFLLEGS